VRGRADAPPGRRSAGRARLAGLLALLPVALAAAAGGGGAQGVGRIEVERLEFVGNEAFPDDSLDLAIVNRETQCFPVLGFPCSEEYLNRRELPRDMARLQVYYYRRGYREARVDTTLVYGEGTAAITFHIDEGRPVLIDSLRFVGGEGADTASVFRGLAVSEGDPLSEVEHLRTRDTLLTRLRNAGYVHADVLRSLFIPTATPYAARVTYDVEPGPRARFGAFDIRVGGEADLSEEVVRRMLPFEEGTVYSEALVQQGQRNLYNLEIVRSALIQPDSVRTETEPDTLVPLLIEVGTGTLHRVRAGGGWNQAECLNTEALWVSRNYLGGARRLQVRGRLSNILAESLSGSACPQSGVGAFGGVNWSVSTELNQPWVFSPRNSLITSLFWERQALPDVFVRRGVGLNLLLTRRLGIRMPLVLSYRPQRGSLEAAGIFFCTSFLVCTPEDIAVLEADNLLSPVGVSVSRDRTDNLLNPSDGYAALIDLEHASAFTGSDFAYTRAIFEASWYHSLARRTVLAARVRTGWIGAAEFGEIEDRGADIIHPQKRFFAGGSNSVRGFAQNRLGPRVLSVDVRNLLGPATVSATDTVLGGECTPEEVVAFICDATELPDGSFSPRPTGGTRLLEASVEYRFAFGGDYQGVTFLDVGQVYRENASFDVGALEWSPGLGVRYFSPIGPLRLDVAYRFQGAEQLPVVTSSIRPFVPGEDDPGERITIAVADSEERVAIPWVRTDDLALLAPPVLFGEETGSFLQRLQLHISIGQAF